MFIDRNYGFITGSDSGRRLENICPVKSREQVERAAEKQSSWQQSPGKGWVSLPGKAGSSGQDTR